MKTIDYGRPAYAHWELQGLYLFLVRTYAAVSSEGRAPDTPLTFYNDSEIAR